MKFTYAITYALLQIDLHTSRDVLVGQPGKFDFVEVNADLDVQVRVRPMRHTVTGRDIRGARTLASWRGSLPL